MTATNMQTFTLAILVLWIGCAHHVMPAAAAAAPPAAAEQAHALNTAVSGDNGRMLLREGINAAAFFQTSAVAPQSGKPDAAPAFDFADIEVSTSLPPPPTPKAGAAQPAAAAAAAAQPAATAAAAAAAQPAAATAFPATSVPTATSYPTPSIEYQEGLSTEVETGTEADQSDASNVGEVIDSGLEQQLSILAAVSARRANHAATKSAGGMSARGSAAPVQGNKKKKARTARHSKPDSSSSSSSSKYEDGTTASHNYGLEDPAQAGDGQEADDTHQKGSSPRRHGPKDTQRNKAATGPSTHNLQQHQQQQQPPRQHRHHQHQEPQQQQHPDQEDDDSQPEELSHPSTQDEPSTDAPKAPARQNPKTKSSGKSNRSKSRSTGSSTQGQGTTAAPSSKQQLQMPAGRKHKHAKSTPEVSEGDSQVEVSAADAGDTGDAAGPVKDRLVSSEDSPATGIDTGFERTTNPQEGAALERPSPWQRKHKVAAHLQGTKGARKQAGQEVQARLMSAEGSAEASEPNAVPIVSQGRLRDASAELQIVYTGDGQDSGPEDLDGGLMWTVSADSGRSSSLNMLQPDGQHGSWAIVVTQVFKWANAPGVRPFLAFDGPVHEPTSVTIKGKLGGIVPGSQHQTQLTSSSTVSSGGRVPRDFANSARVQLSQPKQCTYKWHSPDALDNKVECRGLLVSAAPVLEFDATFADFLSAGLHQDLPFMEQLEVTCKIVSCSSA